MSAIVLTRMSLSACFFPTHAAVYSDGSMALISTSDFAALDFSRFRDLKELYPDVKTE
jgi:hypothetical protein